MNRKPPHVAWFIFAAIVILIVLSIGLGILIGTNFTTGSELILGLMIILGVSVLTVLLFIVAAAFKSLNLTDPRQALGLPPGSVRAMIAFLLIIVWAIVSIFVFRLVAFGGLKGVAASADGVKLAQQLFTTMSTLVVAIVAFYFGSRSVQTAQSALAPAELLPVITNIFPKKGNQGQADILLTIIGKNLGSPKSVRLALDQEPPVVAKDISYTQTDVSMIECTISLANNQKLGQWDVIVVNYDNNEYKLEKAFQVIQVTVQPPAQPPAQPPP